MIKLSIFYNHNNPHKFAGGGTHLESEATRKAKGKAGKIYYWPEIVSDKQINLCYTGAVVRVDTYAGIASTPPEDYDECVLHQPPRLGLNWMADSKAASRGAWGRDRNPLILANDYSAKIKKTP